MPFLRCPDSETLFEFISIPKEISRLRWAILKLHASGCKPCQARIHSIRSAWQAYFTPEPDVTTSLMKVYSRLQNDQTLVLKGWKLGEFRSQRDLGSWLFKGGWLFRGGVSFGIVAILVVVIFSQMQTEKSTEKVASNLTLMPVAQFRFEDGERTKVRYVKPELLQSVEFETTSVR